MATHAIESSSPTQANEDDHEGVAERQGSKSLGLADSNPTAIQVNCVDNDDNDANNNITDSNEAVVAEDGETKNVANDDVNINASNEVVECTAANLVNLTHRYKGYCHNATLPIRQPIHQVCNW